MVVVEGTVTQPNSLDLNYLAWEDKDLATKLDIMSKLEDQQTDAIRNCCTANAMWIDLRTNSNHLQTEIRT